jgi:hypothetical protein
MRCHRNSGRLLLAPLLALAAPLAAQDSEPAPAPAAPAPASEPGPIILVSGSDRLTRKAGHAPLDPAAELCLDRGEEAVLASDRVTFTLTGEACVIPAVAERATYDAYRAAIVDDARTALIRAMYSEDPERLAAARADYVRVMREVMGIETDGMIELPPVEAEVVGSTGDDTPRPRKRVRTGALRGDRPPPPPPRPVIFRIASGSPPALARFPRGTLVQRGTPLCLKAGEQVSIAGSNGQSVTYTGPGCLNRTVRPTRDNVGGFTFG